MTELRDSANIVMIRPAQPHELHAVGELTVQAYRADGYLNGAEGYVSELADAESRARRAELLVAVDDDNHLLGTVTIAPPGSEYAEVSRDNELEFRMLAVAPGARRRGIGKALVRAVLDRARALGLPRVVLCSQDRMTSVHHLYQRLGFRRLPERDWQPIKGVHLIAFALDLELP